MSLRACVLILIGLTAGCAPPLDGIWSGTATERWTCSNGDEKTVTSDISLVFGNDPQGGYFAWITPYCGSPRLKVTGNTGELARTPWGCMTLPIGTGFNSKSDNWELRSGRFIVDGNTMVGSWATSHSIGDPVEYTCSTEASGTFTAAD